MKVTRRQFIKITGLTGVSLAMVDLGFSISATAAETKHFRLKDITPTPTICPYCGSGCGLLVYAERDASGKYVKLLSVEGDPDNPNNRGGACAKGAALFNMREIYDEATGKQVENPKRVKTPLYRAPGSEKWEEKDWDWMLERIAERVKGTRDKSFIHKEKLADGSEIIVNRTEKIAAMGGSPLDNEECYLESKLMRALGVVYLETQARLCHSSTVPALSASFGRGAMTNHIVDLRNTDCALIMGSNCAENHPITMKWLTMAREQRGAKLISVDPRFTRTSAVADIYCPMRSGTDIAFLGGMIKYILDNKLYNEEYVVNYTNASFLVSEGYDFNDGLFSGYDASSRKYDTKTWDYQYGEDGLPLKDPTLSHPRCVFQLMKKHYERYDIDTVCAITGSPKDQYLKVLETFCATGAPDKAGTILYAMGITQHTAGVQNIRAFSIVQMLLGNMGRPGGGINALRGENNVQGATDMALLYHIIPGYITSPSNAVYHEDLTSFLKKETPGAANLPATNLDELLPLLHAGIPNSGFRINTSKWLISLLKAWWGDAATKENDWAYHYLPKRNETKNYSHIAMFEAMHKGEIDGLFIFGGNPVVGGPNANKEQEALCNLKWLVVTDLWLHETAEFWSYKAWERPVDNPAVPKKTPKDIQTEVFFLPACAVYEKEGTASQTGRWVQYRWKGADPIGDSKSDLWIIDQLAKRIKRLYEGSTKPQDEPITRLVWGPYGEGEEPEPIKVGLELNGYTVADGKPVENFTKLADDGSTACGCWIYSGCMTTKEDGSLDYKPMWRDTNDPGGLGLHPKWAWCWPINRRILYNRCSVRPDGTPWPGDEARALVRWDPSAPGDPKTGSTGMWVGLDVPDFNKYLPPTVGPGKAVPFLMRPEGVGCLFAAKTSTKDGPFPEHYEPWESPVKNLLSSTQINPAVVIWEPDKQCDPKQFPIVVTTYRVTEHWQTGALTRNLPWLAELMPNMFVEISEELARLKGIKNGDKAIVSTTRGDIEAVAFVTKRLKPFKVAGRTVHEIGTVWCFGFKGYATGDPANRITAHIGDANTTIPEYKALLCDVRRA